VSGPGTDPDARAHQLFNALSSEERLKLLSTLEVSERSKAKSSQAKMVRTFIRPVLREIKPVRRGSFERWSFVPFEPLLSETVQSKADLAIPRLIVQPLLAWMEAQAEVAALKARFKEFVEADLAFETPWPIELYTEFAAILTAQRKPLERRLVAESGSSAFTIGRAIDVILHCYRIAGEIESFAKEMPSRPILGFGMSELRILLDLITRANRIDQQSARLFIAMLSRMVVEQSILIGLLTHEEMVAFKPINEFLSADFSALVVNQLANDTAAVVADIGGHPITPMTAMRLRGTLKSCAAVAELADPQKKKLLKGFTSSIEQAVDRAGAERVSDQTIGVMMDNLRAIGLPQDADQQNFARLETQLTELARLEKIAGTQQFEARMDKLRGELVATIDAEMTAALAPRAPRGQDPFAKLIPLVRLAEIVTGPDKANELRIAYTRKIIGQAPG
jgi:hypothetical protein